MIEGNLLIRASAGTGKTFSLASRFLRLLLFDGVSPESIVALTFSRAAAQEIYTKILERLCRAARDEVGARTERKNLLDGFDDRALREIDAKNIDWSSRHFADLLRRVVSTQNVGSIATLDSFILRIVRNFPLEMGFQNAIEVLDSPGENLALDNAVKSILDRTGDSDAFIRAVIAALNGKLPRVLFSALYQFLEDQGWRKFVLDHPGCTGWTAESMARAIGIREHPAFKTLDELSVAPLLSSSTGPSKKNQDAALVKFANYLLELPKDENPLPASKKTTIVGEFITALLNHPGDPYVDHMKANGFVEHYDYPLSTFEAARRDLARVVDNFLYHQLQVVEAKLRLMAIVEREYDLSTRRSGRLTFRDFTDYSAVKEDSAQGLAIQNLEFRFDAAFDHWALDEFQDTSEVQWRCLRRLVESAATGGEGRTVIALGDLKQSIYTWRGGDEAPFKEMMGWSAFRAPAGRIADSTTSHRYRQNTCDFLNALFGAKNLCQGNLLPPDRADAIARWLSAECWQVHKAETDANGHPRTDDFVQVIGVRPTDEELPTDRKRILQNILPAVGETIARVWAEHERVQSQETVGLLVRTNEEGLALAEYLRGEGLPAVWEGMNFVADVPAVRAVVMLLHLAEHPEDTFDWIFVNTLLPLREILFPDTDDPAEVSRRISQSLARKGLARTLRDICRALSEDQHGLDALSRLRLNALVRAGVNFERRKERAHGMDDFSTFLDSCGRRESFSSSRMIRILTIHRSKGLTLDRVFVPISEGDRSSIVEMPSKGVIAGKGEKWVLPHVPLDVARMNASVKKAVEVFRDERLLENLRTYYVALTRSRKALYVILPTDMNETIHFRDIVLAMTGRTPLREGPHGDILYERGTEMPFSPPEKNSRTPASAAWTHEKGQRTVERISPSASALFASKAEGLAASALFGSDFGEAAREGDREHDRYATLEWAEGESLESIPEGFRHAFIRPDPTATVWRERAYELFFNGKWESGRFDRVVFSGSGENRQAVVYDFKTNHPRAAEETEAFVQRLRQTYHGQMQLYRQAVCRLAGLRSDQVAAELLLVATGSAVRC